MDKDELWNYTFVAGLAFLEIPEKATRILRNVCNALLTLQLAVLSTGESVNVIRLA